MRKFLSCVFALILIPIVSMPLAAQRTLTTLNTSATTYASGTSYHAGEIVTSGGVSYASLIANNTGNTPSSSPSDWLAIGGPIPGLLNTQRNISASTSIAASDGIIDVAPGATGVTITFPVLAGSQTFLINNSSGSAAVTLAIGAGAGFNKVPTSLSTGNSIIVNNVSGEWTLVAQTVTVDTVNAIGTISNSTTGNAATSTALAAAPTQCSGGQVAAGIAANGNAQGCVSPGGTSTVQLASPVVRYDMLPSHVSGSSLLDTSGNNNTATINTGIVSTQVGLSVPNQQEVSVPSTVNNAKSLIIIVNFNYIIGSSGPAVAQPHFIDNSNGVNGGFSLINQSYFGTSRGLETISTSTQTICGTQPDGYTVIGVTRGTNASTDPDRVYINGHECANYSAQGFSAGALTTGNLILGQITGYLYYFEAFNSELSSTDMINEMNADSSIVASRGVPTSPVLIPQNQPLIIVDGDSMAAGVGSSSGGPSTAWDQYLTLLNQPTYLIENYGVASITAALLSRAAPWRQATVCANSAGPTIDLFDAGVNDLQGNVAEVPPTIAQIASYVGTMKAAGCSVFVGTMISSGGTGQDAAKDVMDPEIRSQWKAWGADGIMDFAADPVLGADGDSTNTTYFNGDKIHPTQLGYQSHMAPAASNSLNYFYGHHASNPHQIVGSGAYQMTSDDGFLEVTSTTATTPITTPECIGPSGAVYTIVNAQSTNAVTIQGTSVEPINGLTTAITIPANSSLSLNDVPNPPAVGGCHWSH